MILCLYASVCMYMYTYSYLCRTERLALASSNSWFFLAMICFSLSTCGFEAWVSPTAWCFELSV